MKYHGYYPTFQLCNSQNFPTLPRHRARVRKQVGGSARSRSSGYPTEPQTRPKSFGGAEADPAGCGRVGRKRLERRTITYFQRHPKRNTAPRETHPHQIETFWSELEMHIFKIGGPIIGPVQLSLAQRNPYPAPNPERAPLWIFQTSITLQTSLPLKRFNMISPRTSKGRSLREKPPSKKKHRNQTTNKKHQEKHSNKTTKQKPKKLRAASPSPNDPPTAPTAASAKARPTSPARLSDRVIRRQDPWEAFPGLLGFTVKQRSLEKRNSESLNFKALKKGQRHQNQQQFQGFLPSFCGPGVATKLGGVLWFLQPHERFLDRLGVRGLDHLWGPFGWKIYQWKDLGEMCCEGFGILRG